MGGLAQPLLCYLGVPPVRRLTRHRRLLGLLSPAWLVLHRMSLGASRISSPGAQEMNPLVCRAWTRESLSVKRGMRKIGSHSAH